MHDPSCVPLRAHASRHALHALRACRGHASEKPELPAALDETPTRIRFLGPPSVAMAALGDKIGSTILAQSAGVPTIPWSGDGVTVDYAGALRGGQARLLKVPGQGRAGQSGAGLCHCPSALTLPAPALPTRLQPARTA